MAEISSAQRRDATIVILLPLNISAGVQATLTEQHQAPGRDAALLGWTETPG